MDALWQKLLVWWHDASPRKRWSSVALAFGIVCTILFILFANSYEPVSTGSIPVTEQMDNPAYYFGVAAKTIGVLVLIVGCAIVLKRVQKNQVGIHSDRGMSVLESIRLSPKQALHLIRVGDEYFLVGATDQNLNLISRVKPSQQADSQNQEAPFSQETFESLLAASSCENRQSQ